MSSSQPSSPTYFNLIIVVQGSWPLILCQSKSVQYWMSWCLGRKRISPPTSHHKSPYPSYPYCSHSRWYRWLSFGIPWQTVGMMTPRGFRVAWLRRSSKLWSLKTRFWSCWANWIARAYCRLSFYHRWVAWGELEFRWYSRTKRLSGMLLRANGRTWGSSRIYLTALTSGTHC